MERYDSARGGGGGAAGRRAVGAERLGRVAVGAGCLLGGRHKPRNEALLFGAAADCEDGRKRREESERRFVVGLLEASSGSSVRSIPGAAAVAAFLRDGSLEEHLMISAEHAA